VVFADAKPAQGRFTPPKARLVRERGTVNHEPERFAGRGRRIICGALTILPELVSGRGTARPLAWWWTGSSGRICLPPKEKWGRPCGRPHSHRRVVLAEARSLTPGVSMPDPTGPCEQLKVGFHSPGARAGAGSVGGRDRSRGPVPCLPAVPRPYRRPGPQAAFVLPEGSAKSSVQAGKCGLSDFAPFRFQRSGIWSAPGRTFVLSSSHPSTERHLAVVSLRFQNPFSVAGLSAFVSEGPIPVSMIGRCAAWPIRASAGPSSYPLSA
jgi:hypothetical protein